MTTIKKFWKRILIYFSIGEENKIINNKKVTSNASMIKIRNIEKKKHFHVE